jgi:glycoside/pentoside/hexuronide:cation symporter, GPH family
MCNLAQIRMSQAKLPLKMMVIYSFGMMGWSVLVNLISVILVYLYLPPATSGLPALITQVTIFGIFNAVALITAGGRLIDAVYDPFIAQFSDRSTNPRGRRTPIMKWAIIPSILFCFLVFYPLHQSESSANIFWLIFTLVLFYVASTSYIIPYNALLPELAKTSDEKVKLATWQSLGYVFGIGISSNAFNLTDALQTSFGIDSKITALQITVFIMASLAGLFMGITAFFIDEKKYCTSQPSSTPLKAALKQTLTNKNFLLFVVADFSYFISVTLITSGLMYFVTVLLPLKEDEGNKLMITMVLVSLIFYPITNYLAGKIGKKKIVLFSLVLLSMIFLGIYYLGKFELPPKLQIYVLVSLAAIPLASLNILPNAILADIIEKDSRDSGQNKEAIYFAVRYFFVKLAQTFGMAVFAMLLIHGKDVGNDLGVRLNGMLGFGLCIIAALIFTRFKEIQRDV